VLRGQDRPDSDLDLLVEFASPKSLLDLVGMQQELEDALGRKVRPADTGVAQSIHP
jgi:hypothetical protein